VSTSRSPLAGVATAAIVVTAVTLVLYPVSELDPGVSSGVLYVLGVLLVASYWGLWLGLLTSLGSALALAYFHARPRGSFDVENAGDAVAIGVLLLTAVVASFIADRARQRAEAAEQRLALEEELRRRDAERIRLQAVHVSRARVLAAADEERRRVVRDLHDGAQQRLVHTVVTLKLAQQALGRQDRDSESLVREALDQAEQANAELRELARGMLPTVLTRGGLRAGVDALVARTPVPVEVDVLERRLPPAVEATAYFVIAEALTNVAKHARARGAEVTASVNDGRVYVAVRDDGVGGARQEGSGLLGLDDRVAALDGDLQVTSPAYGGTLIEATIPVPGSGEGENGAATRV
jgi:signal transduction histidine kinase